jgi:hypothetical protein
MSAEVVAAGSRRRLGARIAVAVAFLLAFLWQIYGAVSNLVVWLNFADAMKEQLSATAWIVLLIGIAVPVIAYVAGLVLGRRRRVGALALVLLLALCVSEALTLSQLAFFLSVVGAL